MTFAMYLEHMTRIHMELCCGSQILREGPPAALAEVSGWLAASHHRVQLSAKRALGTAQCIRKNVRMRRDLRQSIGKASRANPIKDRPEALAIFNSDTTCSRLVAKRKTKSAFYT